MPGILIHGTVDMYDLADFDRMVATNVRGVFVAIQASSPHLREGGRIITIGSNTAVRTAFPGASVYSMTKGAIASLVRGIAIDLAPRGITVNNVQPGPTETDMTAAYAEMVKPLVPLGRLGKPEEIAGLVAYLARPEAGFITGASQTIDGGYVA
jgi:3-oxoacyl-[acyl-carrier protein] reductase